MATMQMDPHEGFLLDALTLARTVFEETGECAERLVPIRNGQVEFERLRVLGESANGYARVARELGAVDVVIYGAKPFTTEPGGGVAVRTVHAQLVHCTGEIVLFATQARIGTEWGEPVISRGPFSFKGEEWNLERVN